MINDVGLLRRIKLKELRFGHLDWKKMSPARAHYVSDARSPKERWVLHRVSLCFILGFQVPDCLSSL
jgi:hypothetical protein